MKRLLFVLCAVAVNSAAAQTKPAITPADLRQRLYLIADDSMMGRETGSAGAYKTSAYVAAEFRRLGLAPAGDSGGRSYFQTVPFWDVKIDPSSRLVAGGGASLRLGTDFLPTSFAAPPRALEHIAVVYAGSVADTTHLMVSADGTGKFVVLDVPQGFDRRALGPMVARYRDAASVGLVALDQLGSEQIARVLEGRPVADTSRNPRAIPLVWLSRAGAAALLGKEPAAISPGTVTGTTVSGQYDFPRTPVAYPARNVVGILRGSDPALRTEYVSLSAHHDHVGFDHYPVDHDSLRAFNRVVRPMGADSPMRPATPDEQVKIRKILDSLRAIRPPRPDSIRNGADDDGSGTVAILEIAEAFASARGAERPRRSILFISHTGEEAGLLGSRWYSDHATVPIDSIVGEIDEDMVGRGTASDFPRGGTGAGGPTYLEVIGAKRISREFGEMLEAANAKQPVPFVFDYTYDAPGHPLQYYCRADHYSYARYGIPSVSFSRGEHVDYHQVTDEPQYISYEDLARVAQMVHDGALAIANAPQRPKRDVPKPVDPHAPCVQ
ncbi:MAG TPA: M28 family peptidase [Gemmatimonadales bacterium]|nr:M28 family peptidase [Gemmatimonadales bacterium]